MAFWRKRMPKQPICGVKIALCPQHASDMLLNKPCSDCVGQCGTSGMQHAEQAMAAHCLERE